MTAARGRLAGLGWPGWCRLVSLMAALALAAQSEWQLAVAVGWPPAVAWAAPVALDMYVLAAMAAGRDVGGAVVIVAASVMGSHAVYATPTAWSSGTVGVGHLHWWLAAVCSVVPLLVFWRVHHLAEPAPVVVAEVSDRPADPAEVAEPVALAELGDRPAEPVAEVASQLGQAEAPPAGPADGRPGRVADPASRLLAALPADGRAVGYSDFEHIGMARSTVKVWLADLIRDGDAVRVAPGRFARNV